jgi:fusion and transport protein UGO1
MDYTDYLSDASPSPREIGRSLVEHAIWKYTSIFLAQPFDVAKLVLQAQKGGTGQRRIKDTSTEDPRKPSRNQRRDPYEVFL